MTIAESINPPNIPQAIASGHLVPKDPVVPGGHAVPTPDPPGLGRNPFLICSHPLVTTVDSLRQFYRQGVPQFRTNLFVS